MIKALAVFLLLGSAPASSATSSKSVDSAIRPHIDRGFNYLYDLEYDNAKKEFQKIIELAPEDPAGYAYLATCLWLEELNRGRELTFENFISASYFTRKPARPVSPQLDERFGELTDLALEKANNLIAKDPLNPRALCYLGTTHGTISAYHATIKRKVISALRHGTKAFEYHSKVIEMDPSFYDSYLAIGLYDYIAGSLPKSVRWLAFLLGYRGNKERGLHEIKLAAEKGRYNSKDAKVILIVLSIREKRLQEAVRYLAELYRQHPKNYLLLLDLASAYKMMSEYRKAIDLYQEALDKIRIKAPHFEELPSSQVHFRLGEMHLAANQASSAVDSFMKVITDGNADENLITLAHLRLGQAYDTLKDRRRAIAHYQVVLERKDIDRAQDLARKYLKKPYEQKIG